MTDCVALGTTHLYPGARLELHRDPAPAALTLVFSDGVRVAAELLRDDRGRLALRVDAYRTAAGTAIPERLWPASSTPERLILGRAYPHRRT